MKMYIFICIFYDFLKHIFLFVHEGQSSSIDGCRELHVPQKNIEICKNTFRSWKHLPTPQMNVWEKLVCQPKQIFLMGWKKKLRSISVYQLIDKVPRNLLINKGSSLEGTSMMKDIIFKPPLFPFSFSPEEERDFLSPFHCNFLLFLPSSPSFPCTSTSFPPPNLFLHNYIYIRGRTIMHPNHLQS